MLKAANIIVRLREEEGITQKELANAIGINASVMNRIEAGKRPLRDDEAVKIADFFGVTIDYLFGRTKVKNPQGPSLDDEANELLEELHKRPEMKMLFSVSKKATKEDIEKAIKIIEALKDN